MPNNWKLENTDENFVPEIRISANGASAGDKIFLYNILNGAYGVPSISGGTESDIAGQAEDIVIRFGTVQPPVSNFDSLVNHIKINPEWFPSDYYEEEGKTLVVENYTDYELAHYDTFGTILENPKWVTKGDDNSYNKETANAAVKNLYFSMDDTDWEKIADLNPEIVIRIYRTGSAKGSERPKTSSGLKPIPAYRTGVVPLTSKNTALYFGQEEYFRLNATNDAIAAKGKRVNLTQFQSQYFEFSLRITHGEDVYETSNPIELIVFANRNNNGWVTISYGMQ